MKKLAVLLLAIFAVTFFLPSTNATAERRKCWECDGTGRIESYEPSHYNKYTGEKMSEGHVVYKVCGSCGGKGYKDR